MHAGDPGDDLAQRFDIGDVEGRIDVDAACQQLADVLPASRVALTGQPGRDLYVSVLVVYEVNNLLAGVDMTERVAGAWMHEKMD